MLPAPLRSPLRRLLLRTPAGTRLWWRWHGLAHELDFWSRWFELEGAHWNDDYRRRLDPTASIEDPLVTARLDDIEPVDVRVIDVGAGPITKLGTRYPGKRIELVPVDPLADEYEALLKRYEIEPPVRTIKAHGERLLEQFAPGTFDIAYATNSLDHSYDPLLIVRNMLALVNEAGVVLLRHVLREGVRQQWVGPHQWNFDVDGGDVLIWNHAVRHSLGSALAAQASVEGWVEDGFVLVRLTPFGSAAPATGS